MSDGRQLARRGAGVVARQQVAAELARLVQAPPRLVIPPALGYQIDEVLRDRRWLPEVPLPVLSMARKLLPSVEQRCEPVAFDQVEAWMTLLTYGSGSAPAAEAVFKLRIAMVYDTVADLPWVCFTQETRRAYAQQGEKARFFPSDAEVYAFARPFGQSLLAQRAALRQMVEHADLQRSRVSPPEPDAARTAVTDARDAALTHLGAGSRREARREAPPPAASRGVRAPADPPKPSVLTGEALWRSRCAAREATGLPPLPRPASFEGYGVVAPGKG